MCRPIIASNAVNYSTNTVDVLIRLVQHNNNRIGQNTYSRSHKDSLVLLNQCIFSFIQDLNKRVFYDVFTIFGRLFLGIMSFAV